LGVHGFFTNWSGGVSLSPMMFTSIYKDNNFVRGVNRNLGERIDFSRARKMKR